MLKASPILNTRDLFSIHFSIYYIIITKKMDLSFSVCCCVDEWNILFIVLGIPTYRMMETY